MEADSEDATIDFTFEAILELLSPAQTDHFNALKSVENLIADWHRNQLGNTHKYRDRAESKPREQGIKAVYIISIIRATPSVGMIRSKLVQGGTDAPS